MGLVISEEDPGTPDIVGLLERHLELMRSTTPAEFVFALDLAGLRVPTIRFFAARLDGTVLGVGALKRLGPTEGELKSMHTAAEARGRGVGAAIVDRLIDTARADGLRRVSLETGVGPVFEPAHRLYERAGFVRCGAFADYPDVDSSVFMTLGL